MIRLRVLRHKWKFKVIRGDFVNKSHHIQLLIVQPTKPFVKWLSTVDRFKDTPEERLLSRIFGIQSGSFDFIIESYDPQTGKLVYPSILAKDLSTSIWNHFYYFFSVRP